MTPVAIPADAAADTAARSGLKQRVLTALVLVPLLLAGIFLLPNAFWALLMCGPIALAALEWSRLAGYRRRGSRLFTVIVTATCLGFIVLGASAPPLPAGAAGAAEFIYVLALLFWAIAVPAWLYFKWIVSQPLTLALTGWIVLVPAWLAIVALQKSAGLLIIVLLTVWIADIAAYFSGRRFGRRKLAPQISPGKTWEGVFGAVAAVLIFGFIASFVLKSPANLYDRIVTMIFVFALTVLGIVGDLFESWMKRGAGAKDSGSLLPGHGGVLDRIDSLTAALPFAALYFLPALR